MEISKILEERIKNNLQTLSSLSPDTDEYAKIIDNTSKLISKYIEIIKEKDQTKSDHIHKFIDHGITLIGIIIPAGLTVWGIMTSLVFEEKGTISSIVGRGLFNKIIPKL